MAKTRQMYGLVGASIQEVDSCSKQGEGRFLDDVSTLQTVDRSSKLTGNLVCLLVAEDAQGPFGAITPFEILFRVGLAPRGRSQEPPPGNSCGALRLTGSVSRVALWFRRGIECSIGSHGNETDIV